MANEPATAFVAFSLGPVQSFIAAARSVRDLWTGSYLLAWLTRHAMQPILDARGRDAFVSPAVTDNPAIDLHKANLRSPCLPNWFLAEVPALAASEMAVECERACRDEWQRLCRVVRSRIQEHFCNGTGQWVASWYNLWDDQVRSFFDIRTVVLPDEACTEAELERLLGDKRCTVEGSNELDRLWTDRAELAAAMLAAMKSVRHIPNYRPKADGAGQFAPKCSLMGSYEQMGPAGLDASREFWEWFADYVHFGGSRTRKRERLCAVSLVKRFVWAADLSKQVGSNSRAMRLEDTATVAAAKWLLSDERKQSPKIDPDQVRKDRGTWSGQWLHWSKQHQDEDEDDPCPDDVGQTIEHKRREQGKPPIYYAILMLDGDRMGDALRRGAGRKHRRQISRAVSQFAIHRVRQLVEEQHHGTLIYSGGDDVLAMLPTAAALGCARDLAAAFDETWRQHGPQNIPPITVSAGLAVVHYKEDLRFALDVARRAEKKAKDSGRDALYLTVCRRSGEHTSATCPWNFVDKVADWVKAFLPEDDKPGASDRWAYHLAGELPTLRGLDVLAMTAEIRRQVNRSEVATREKLGGTQAKLAGDLLAEQFDRFRSLVLRRQMDDAQALADFVTLCQSASFLARGRDE